MNKDGVEADILTFFPVEGDTLPGTDLFIKAVKLPSMQRLSYSKPFLSFLSENNDYELYHVNGLWQYPPHCTSKYARETKKPYIISPHGMLYPSALEYSKTIKKVFMNIWFKNDIQKADCIHVTCEEEMRHVRNLGFTNPIAIIPNPVDILPGQKGKSPDEKRKNIAFIGRFSPIKCIDRLIKAWHSLGSQTQGYNLLIVGDGEQRKELEALASSLQIVNIEFTGFLKGSDKLAIYEKLRSLVLPSQSENFGMVVAEALLNSVPVIASKGTPWKDLSDYKCGWWVDNSIEELANAIEKTLSSTDTEIEQMGENGRNLVLEKYSTEVVSNQMKQLYEYLIRGGSKPDFVYLN